MELTAKGAATRSRIVGAAADLVLRRGARGTSLDDICTGTATSKSQLFHYFPGGKAELVRAIVALQGERVMDAQRPALDRLDSWDAWDRWHDLVLAHYERSDAVLGCPIGSLASEMAAVDPVLRREIAEYFETWRMRMERGLESMRSQGLLRPSADPAGLALATLASLQGGLLLTQTTQSFEPLEVALRNAVEHLQSWAAHD
jgi:AcrR family transcriptional regulator